MTETTLDRLRNQIADGFRDAPLLSSVDEIADDFEVPEVRQLVGKRWSVIPQETIVRMNWDLHWFHRMGIRQYLPAFMLVALRNSETAETVIAYLAGSAGERSSLWPDEKRAVRAWLHHMRDELKNEDAAKALETYWENPPITPLEEECVALFSRAREVFAPDRTPQEATELAAAVTEVLERGSGAYRQHVKAASPDDVAKRAPLVYALSIDQLAFIADFLDYSRRCWPDLDDDVNVRFWRAQLVARQQ